VDVRDDTTTGDGGFDQGIELLITADGELQMAGSDALDFEILGRIAGQLQHFGSQVLEDGGAVDSSRSTDTAVGREAALEESVDTTDRELQASTRRARYGSFLVTSHVDNVWLEFGECAKTERGG
jgi:hypothetical protein